MIVDQEWGSLREAWITETDSRQEARRENDALARLKLEVKRQGRRLLVRFVLNLVLGVFFLVHSAALAYFQSDHFTIVWAVAIWVFTIWALGITIRNRRGLWRPETETTSSFVGISIRRCEAGLLSIRHGFRLLAWEYVFVAAFLIWKMAGGWDLSPDRTILLFSCLIGFTALVTANMLSKGRRLRAELARWREYEESSVS